MNVLWWHWIVFGLILALGEVATPGGFFLLFFGTAAIIVGLLDAAGVAQALWVQLALFSILSVGSLVLFRGRLQQRLNLDSQLQPAVDQLVGEIGVVAGELVPGAIGKVEVRGSAWSARNTSGSVLAPGTRCRVLAVDGLMLDVAPERNP
jgi:membrane protein implicated in regulation of membrane protease activity